MTTKFEAAAAMLAALKATTRNLLAFYDPAEDNAHDPIMRATGRALERANKAIAAAKAAGIKVKG